jgi:L-aspartate oxidase
MERYHPMADLAPRDVVSRSIVSEMRRTASPHVFLDLRHLEAAHICARFPRIYETCLQYGIDITRDLVPVHPAAHYAMGGVRTNLDGQTSVERLYAAGEAACTGVHGANRLASNSLLEGVVFGARAGAAMRRWAGSEFVQDAGSCDPEFPSMSEEVVRRIAWEHCGIVRDGRGLSAGLNLLECAGRSRNSGAGRADYELRSIHTVASLIALCALARKESRGGHYRSDFPEKREEFRRHSVIRGGSDVSFEEF